MEIINLSDACKVVSGDYDHVMTLIRMRKHNRFANLATGIFVAELVIRYFPEYRDASPSDLAADIDFLTGDASESAQG